MKINHLSYYIYTQIFKISNNISSYAFVGIF